jgi:hypothetical protein
VLLNEPVMLFFYHVIASIMMRPQLIQIQNVLNSVALEISKDERTSDDEINFIQYLSGACRAARAHQAVILPSAALLRHLSDFDLSLCRESRNASIGFSAGVFLVLLALFSFGTDDLHEGIFCIFWSGLFSSFALATDYLTSFSISIPILLYTFIALVIVYYVQIYKPRYKQRIRGAPVNGYDHLQPEMWQSSHVFRNPSRLLRRSLRLFTSRKYANYKSPVIMEWRNMNLPSHLHGEASRIPSFPELSQDPMIWDSNLSSQLSSKMNCSEDNHSRLPFVSRVGQCVPSLTRCLVGDLSVISPQRLPISLHDKVISTHLPQYSQNNFVNWKKHKTQKNKNRIYRKYFDEAEALFKRLDVDQKGYLAYSSLQPLAIWYLSYISSLINTRELPTYEVFIVV